MKKNYLILFIDRKIQEFADKCEYELNAIKFTDSLTNNTNDQKGYQLFTDLEAMRSWYNSDTTRKVLLKADGEKSCKCNYFEIFLKFNFKCFNCSQFGAILMSSWEIEWCRF